MTEFLESLGRWFWDVNNLGYTISHLVLLAVILALVITLIVFIMKGKKSRKVARFCAEREESKDKEIVSLRTSIYDKETEIAQLNKKIETMSGKIDDAKATAALNKEYARIFKESLLVSRKTATIAVDTSNILDSFSVDEIKEYAAQIGAKIKSGMNKAEMIKVIRSTEVMRKNLEK